MSTSTTRRNSTKLTTRSQYKSRTREEINCVLRWSKGFLWVFAKPIHLHWKTDDLNHVDKHKYKEFYKIDNSISIEKKNKQQENYILR